MLLAYVDDEALMQASCLTATLEDEVAAGASALEAVTVEDVAAFGAPPGGQLPSDATRMTLSVSTAMLALVWALE